MQNALLFLLLDCMLTPIFYFESGAISQYNIFFYNLLNIGEIIFYMRASIPLFYEQSPFCSSFSLELYIYKFISYTLLYIEETEVLSFHNRGFFW